MATNEYADGSTFKHVIRSFNGGLLEDKRIESPNHFSITKHFDTFTYPMKLVPYAETIASNGTTGTGITALGLTQFLYGQSASNPLYSLFALGVDGSANAQVYKFPIDTGTPNTSQWIALANSDSSHPFDPNVFFYYKLNLYWLSQGNHIVQADAYGVNAINDDWNSLTYVDGSGVQPVHHPQDDVAYFFGTNTVSSLNASSWTSGVLTLPTNEQITCACAFGTYLAIGTVTQGGSSIHSKVYLWDRDSSLATVTDVVDFGEGSLTHLASLNNKLIGVVNYYIDNLYSLNKGRIVIREQSGNFAVDLNEITTDTTNPTLPKTSVVKNNLLYFPMSAELDGDYRQGIWVVNYKGLIALDTVEAAIASNQSFTGIFNTGNMWWISYAWNGTTSYTTHSDQAGAYSSSNPSVWESLILSTVFVTGRGTVIMNSATLKKLVGITGLFEPLTTGQSITVKYRIDTGLTTPTWTTIFTANTVGLSNYSAVNITSDAGGFPEYYEIQFRVESLGGAVFTGIEYGSQVVDNQPY